MTIRLCQPALSGASMFAGVAVAKGAGEAIAVDVPFTPTVVILVGAGIVPGARSGAVTGTLQA
jgi:hypothetical protein